MGVGRTKWNPQTKTTERSTVPKQGGRGRRNFYSWISTPCWDSEMPTMIIGPNYGLLWGRQAPHLILWLQATWAQGAFKALPTVTGKSWNLNQGLTPSCGISLYHQFPLGLQEESAEDGEAEETPGESIRTTFLFYAQMTHHPLLLLGNSTIISVTNS